MISPLTGRGIRAEIQQTTPIAITFALVEIFQQAYIKSCQDFQSLSSIVMKQSHLFCYIPIMCLVTLLGVATLIKTDSLSTLLIPISSRNGKIACQ